MRAADADLTEEELDALEAMAKAIAAGVIRLAGVSSPKTATHATMLALIYVSNQWSSPGTEADNLEAVARAIQEEADLLRTKQ